MNTYKDSESLC